MYAHTNLTPCLRASMSIRIAAASKTDIDVSEGGIGVAQKVETGLFAAEVRVAACQQV